MNDLNLNSKKVKILPLTIKEYQLIIIIRLKSENK